MWLHLVELMTSFCKNLIFLNKWFNSVIFVFMLYNLGEEEMGKPGVVRMC